MLIKFSFLVILAALTLPHQEAMAAPICPRTPPADKAARTVDLRGQIGPIRDQDGVGWCYAFTVADMVSHYLYKKTQAGWSVFGKTDYRRPENMVSAVGISGIFNKDVNKAFFDHMVNARDSKELYSKFNMSVAPNGGTVPAALEAISRNGICFEKDISSEDYGHVRDIRCATKDMCNIDEVLKVIYESGNQDCCQNYSLIQKMFPRFSLEQIKTILKYSEKRNAFNRLLSVACKDSVNKGYFSNDNKINFKYYVLQEPKAAPGKPGPAPKPKPNAPVFNKWAAKGFQTRYDARLPKDKLVLQIDESLNRGNPPGIHYSSSFLQVTGAAAAGNTGHASSIVGKYFNPKTCEVEYILRNSWGANCGAVIKENPGFEKCAAGIKGNPLAIFTKYRACRSQFPPLPRNPQVRCDPNTGYLFVPRSLLADHISGVTTIIGP